MAKRNISGQGVGRMEREYSVSLDLPALGSLAATPSYLLIWVYIPNRLHIERSIELSCICCAKRESGLLCVTELQDGAGLAISGSQIRTESWHRITQPVVYRATQLVRGGMRWHPGVSDFKVLPSPFVPMYSKSSLRLVWHWIALKQVLTLPRWPQTHMWLGMILSCLTSCLSLTGVRIPGVYHCAQASLDV